MGCNCSKRATATGFGRGGTSRDAQAAQRAGADSATPRRFEHTDTAGKATEHGSRLEASAARVRSGGTIRPLGS